MMGRKTRSKHSKDLAEELSIYLFFNIGTFDQLFSRDSHTQQLNPEETLFSSLSFDSVCISVCSIFS